MTTRLAWLITGVFGGIVAAVLAIFAFSFHGMGYESGRVEGCRAAALNKSFTGRTLRTVPIDGEWSITYWDSYCSVHARLRGQPDDRVATWRYGLETGDLYAQESWAFEVFPADGRLPEPVVHRLPASDAVRWRTTRRRRVDYCVVGTSCFSASSMRPRNVSAACPSGTST